MFARNGIRGERITLLGRRPRPEYFKLYQAIDICLDPFPFNGCNTSADALWMGVPVIMLAGKTYVSRQGVSLLSHLGLPELIAATPEDYVQIATRLASDLDRLQALRSGLRERMCRSTLMNPLRFTAPAGTSLPPDVANLVPVGVISMATTSEASAAAAVSSVGRPFPGGTGLPAHSAPRSLPCPSVVPVRRLVPSLRPAR